MMPMDWTSCGAAMAERGPLGAPLDIMGGMGDGAAAREPGEGKGADECGPICMTCG